MVLQAGFVEDGWKNWSVQHLHKDPSRFFYIRCFYESSIPNWFAEQDLLKVVEISVKQSNKYYLYKCVTSFMRFPYLLSSALNKSSGQNF